jgi:hypothetical protein
VLLPAAWSSHPPAGSALSGAPLVARLISLLSRPAPDGLVSLELSAVSAAYVADQMTCHIPYKLGVDPSGERLFEIGGRNRGLSQAAREQQDTPDASSNGPAAAASSPHPPSSPPAPSSLNFFGSRSKSIPSPLSTKPNKANKQPSPSRLPAAAAANGLIDEGVDPFEFVSALLTLHALFSKVDHLRVNGRHWPAPPPPPDDGAKEYAPPASEPRVDLSLFSNVSVLEVDCVPPERVANLPSLAPRLRLLKFSRCGIFDAPALFGSTPFPALTHFKASSCALDELSGLASSPPPLALLSNLQSLNLSDNNLLSHETALAGLSSLSSLSRLDLSFNALSSMAGCNALLGNVKMLFLTGNRLTSAEGVDRLYSLELLALDNNAIE